MSKMLHSPAEGGGLARVVFHEFDESGQLSEDGWEVEAMEVEPPAPAADEEAVAVEPAPDREVVEPIEAEPGISEEELSRAVLEAEERGRQAGIEAARGGLSRSADALSAALEELSGLRQRLLARNSDDMARLVMGIARQVLDIELSIRPETVLETVRKGLLMAVQSDTYHVFVNPQDLDMVLEEKPLFLAGVSGLKNIVVEADPDVGQGGCRLVSDLGEVDATLEHRLAEIETTLRAGLERKE